MKHILTGDPIDASKLKSFGTVDVLPAENFDAQVECYQLRFLLWLKK